MRGKAKRLHHTSSRKPMAQCGWVLAQAIKRSRAFFFRQGRRCVGTKVVKWEKEKGRSRRKAMKRRRSYENVIRRWYRPAEHECPQCHRTLRQVMTKTSRTVITLQGVIKLIHAGYRCPDPQCAGAQRTYRSVEADALALSGMTYGLDVVLLVGRLHLSQHRSVDEIHGELLERLAPLGVRISRREILYLFDAYCTLLRAASEAKDDQQWLAQVKKNGGIILSVDGIQPDKGNETIYLVRDALTGRVLGASNVTSSETETMKALLAPVVALGVH